jgi:hypothetical protein
MTKATLQNTPWQNQGMTKEERKEDKEHQDTE